MVEFFGMLLIIFLLYLEHLCHKHLLLKVAKLVTLVFHRDLTNQSTSWFDLTCLCAVFSVSQRHQLFIHQKPYGSRYLLMHFGRILRFQEIFPHSIALFVQHQMHGKTIEFQRRHHHENCFKLLFRIFRLLLQLNQILGQLSLTHDFVGSIRYVDLSKKLQLWSSCLIRAYDWHPLMIRL